MSNELHKRLEDLLALVESKENYLEERMNKSPENSTLSLAHSIVALIKYDVRKLHDDCPTYKPLSNAMGVDEASELWNLSAGYIKNLCAENKIICKKIGKTWVIDKNQPNPSKSSE